MKRGFTLVELSIVLVIIGLLIGGIIVASSMIETAKINSQVKQIEQFDVAVANFQTKYNGLPGDSSITGCTGSYCNNGIITDDTANGVPLFGGWYFHGDTLRFWYELQTYGGLKSDVTFGTTLPAGGFNTGATKNGPVTTLNSKASVIVSATKNDGTAIVSTFRNVYQLADYSALNESSHAGNTCKIQDNAQYAFSSMQALALDKKMDDGLPVTGIVQTRAVGGLYFATGNPVAPCATTTAYGTSNQEVCVVSINLLGAAGMQ